MDRVTEFLFNWFNSSNPRVFQINILIVALFSASMAFLAIPAPNTEPGPVVIKERPQKPVRAKKESRVTIHQKWICEAQRIQAQRSYEKIVENAHLGPIDDEAAVNAWIAWSEVEKRCEGIL